MNQNPPQNDPTDRVMKIPPKASPRHDEALLDQSVAETFPASDPIAPAVAARSEPADVNWDEISTRGGLRGRIRQNAPALIAIGTAAVALLAIRALRGHSQRESAYRDAE